LNKYTPISSINPGRFRISDLGMGADDERVRFTVETSQGVCFIQAPDSSLPFLKEEFLNFGVTYGLEIQIDISRNGNRFEEIVLGKTELQKIN